VKRGYRIAIVESDDLIRQLVERWLTEAGHHAKTMSPRALQGGNGFDLIIVNVSSPRAAAPMIRSLQAAHDAPLLLLSARFRHGQGASAQLARQLGVKAILPKPFTREQLLAAIHQMMT
jgi:DNA-binding response OmpR family regulator